MAKQTDSMQIDNFGNIKMAQTDMKNSHLHGATGIPTSGLTSQFSSFVAYNYSINKSTCDFPYRSSA